MFVLISTRIPRTKEALLEIHGIGKYGDRLLEAIEATFKEYNKTQKNCSGSNDSLDSTKTRRDDDDSMGSIGPSKKRVDASVDLDFDGSNADMDSKS
ncbi:ATP-dependent DNA helicase Q-like 4A [Camellia lanceoleosa]|uniref:ATP-dependent DNA helicase Q-like 4A n=1 Tax=Camellia lanceoleosa TaxID=1840588 RepID=A0ACC0FVN0_9ERIC|nr:ATP-dependent DNA helicase Q-like 4A [Camellia lanceoleosa]